MNRILMIALALSSVSCWVDDELPPPCGVGNSPVEAVAPIVPAAADSQVCGSIVATLVVEEDGRVTNPVMARSQFKELHRRKVDSAAYESAVLTAVAKWRFPPVPSRCTKNITVGFQRLDSNGKSVAPESPEVHLPLETK